KPDGNFPNHDPDTSKLEGLKSLQKKVIETKSNLGFAYDGDGDRLAVVDENGKIVYVGVVFSVLIAGALSESPRSKVIYTAIDSKAIEDVIRRDGGVPMTCRVGHSFISQKMLEEDAAVAGELSGHYYFKGTHGADDALFASLKLIEYLTKSNKKISEYEKEFPKYFSLITESNRFDIKESEKFPFIKSIESEFGKEGYKIDTLEGVKVLLDDGWILFRPANTEAKIMICYESKTKGGFEKLKKIADKIIKKIPR
ncbi:MAG TPA: phosphomannomutase/phosphoglucomutase, partial [archaeon]|nr:phosphomannomutase/phosphoglucomutase [archaeon]